MTYIERLVLGCIKTMSLEDLARIEDAIRERYRVLDACEHGIPGTDWCEPCSKERHRALAEHATED